MPERKAGRFPFDRWFVPACTPMTNLLSIRALCKTLVRSTRSTGVFTAEVVEGGLTKVAIRLANDRAAWSVTMTARVVFSCHGRASASLDLADCSEERVLAHWAGYLAANGMTTPKVGQVVSFENGTRTGTVVKVGSKRATLKTRSGAVVTLPFDAVRFDPSK